MFLLNERVKYINAHFNYMTIKVVNVRPDKYLQQGMRYCGGFTIKAILSAYGYDNGHHPKKFLPKLAQFMRFATPKNISQQIEKYDLEAPIRRANTLSDHEKITILEEELRKNRPIILLIGNGYTPKGTYHEVQRHIISHWVSIWGYDNKEKVFFIYDSYVDPKYYDDVPIGNVKRTYNQILRDWKGAVYTRHLSFTYIPVMPSRDKKYKV